MKRGTPSPLKIYWVISIDGVFVRFRGHNPLCPTAFESEKMARNCACRIYAEHLQYITIKKVTRKWLDSVAQGKNSVKTLNTI